MGSDLPEFTQSHPPQPRVDTFNAHISATGKNSSPTRVPPPSSPLTKSKPPSRASTPTTPVLKSKRSLPNLNRGPTPSRPPQFRRTSSNLNPASPSANGSQAHDFPRGKPMTPASVAKEFFRRDLALHKSHQNEVAVFVHDSCYGHRYSRPKTSKVNLSLIVERPERILATVLGATTAYVRLGERHAAGRHGPHPDRDASARPPPFILRKTSRSMPLNHAAVTNVHGTKWMEELQIMCDSAEAKLAMNGKELARPIGYGKDEAGNPLPKLHDGDLYLCQESLAALQGCLGGVCDAIDAVFGPDMTSRAFVCIRPPGHHCSSNFPSGFCWLNNVHVGISYAAMTHGLTHAAIIDFDLHHGDGSQMITWDHNRKAQSLPKTAPTHRKTPIGYYSLHDINSYPCEWGDEEKVRNASLCLQNAHGQSIWNVHLEPWQSLEDFWRIYETKYQILLDKTRVFLQHHANLLRAAGSQPKAAIFLSAGFDASQWEMQGMQRHNVSVPTEFYARFTRDTVALANETGLGVDGRVISVLEGGYSDRALTSGVLSHVCGLCDGSTGNPSTTIDGYNGFGSITDSPVAITINAGPIATESSWWDPECLFQLEQMVAGNAPPPPVKKPTKDAGNYSSPTHASTARMTNHAKERHSLSAQVEARLRLESATPEPPPEVDWVTASYELSRLLIPDDRPTLSCRHDELNAEATKARKARLSDHDTLLEDPTAPATSAAGTDRRQLRDRKMKLGSAVPEAPRPSSRTSNRRTTIAAVHDLPDPTMEGTASSRPRRRSSASSSVLSSFQSLNIDDSTITSSAAPLPVKKSRPTATSRTTTTTTTSTSARKIPSRPDSPRKLTAPSAKTVIPKGRATNSVATEASSQTRSSSPSRHSSTGDVVEELTNGMKKINIKLKMPTAVEHAANQKKLDLEKQTKPRVMKKPPAPKISRTKSASTVSGPRAKIDAKTQEIPTSVSTVQASDSTSKPKQDLTNQPPIQTAKDVPQQAASTINTSEVQARLSIANSNSNRDPRHTVPSSIPSVLSGRQEQHKFVSEPGSTAANSASIASDQQSSMAGATSLITRTSTPPRRMLDQLPVFTATTPIPFAKQEVKPLDEKKPQDSGHRLPPTFPSIWDIPETPQPPQ